MAFNPNIQNGKKPQDSPFLTLAQRNKEGISSDNVKNTQAAYSTQKTQNIFGQEEAQGVKKEGAWFQQEEKGAEEYLQEDEQGNVNFDQEGFYDDAWGINLGNSKTTDPIKAGGAQQKDTHEAKNDLTTMIKQGASQGEIDDAKKELQAQGVSNAEIDTIEEKAQADAGMQKTSGNANKAAADNKENVSGDTKAANNKDNAANEKENSTAAKSSSPLYEGGSSSVSSALNDTASAAGGSSGQSVISEVNSMGVMSNSELNAALNAPHSKSTKSSSSSSSSSGSSGSSSTAANLGQQLGTTFATTATTTVAGKAVEGTWDSIANAFSTPKDVKEAENNLNTAKSELEKAQTADKEADTKVQTAQTELDNITKNSDVDKQYSQDKAELDKLNQEIPQKEKEAADAGKTQTDKAEEGKQARADESSNQKRATELGNEIPKLKSELEATSSTLTTSKADLQKEEAKPKDKQDAALITRLKNNISDLEPKERQLKADIKTKEGERKTALENEQKAREKAEAAEKASSDAGEKKATLDKELPDLKKRQGELNKAVSDSKCDKKPQIDEANKKLAEAKAEKTKTAAAVTKAQANVTKAETALNTAKANPKQEKK